MPDAPIPEAPGPADLERQARGMVWLAPFWGPSPASDRWGDLDYETAPGSGKIMAPGEAVEFAIGRGWLLARRRAAPGFVLGGDPRGGVLECHWRYEATPDGLAAWRRAVPEPVAASIRRKENIDA